MTGREPDHNGIKAPQKPKARPSAPTIAPSPFSRVHRLARERVRPYLCQDWWKEDAQMCRGSIASSGREAKFYNARADASQ